MSKSDNGRHPNPTRSVHPDRTICGNAPFRPEDLRRISGYGLRGGSRLRPVERLASGRQGDLEGARLYFVMIHVTGTRPLQVPVCDLALLDSSSVPSVG